MKNASLKKIQSSTNQTVITMQFDDKYFYPHWHFHPEYEIMLLENGTGTRYVGDSIQNFHPGEVVLLGPKIPHLWRNSQEYFNGSGKLKSKAKVVYFNIDSWGKDFISLPEMNQIHILLKMANRGVKFSNPDSVKEIKKRVHKLFKLDQLERLVELLSLLKYLALSNDNEILATDEYNFQPNKFNVERLNKISEYILNNLDNKITLSHAASISNMTNTAFCRFFKSYTNKTFVSFVNEARVGYACKLLIENKLNIAEVCYKSGFSTLTNFFIQFKKIKKMTPNKYMKSYNIIN